MGLTGSLLKVFARICEHPHELIEERCKALEMDRAKELRAQKELIKLKDKVGKLELYMPAMKGIELARKLGLDVHRYKSGIAHEFILGKVKRRLDECNEREGGLFIISEGREVAGLGIQPDLLVGLASHDGSDAGSGDTGNRVGIQICCGNKLKDELDNVMRFLSVNYQR